MVYLEMMSTRAVRTKRRDAPYRAGDAWQDRKFTRAQRPETQKREVALELLLVAQQLELGVVRGVRYGLDVEPREVRNFLVGEGHGAGRVCSYEFRGGRTETRAGRG